MKLLCDNRKSTWAIRKFNFIFWIPFLMTCAQFLCSYLMASKSSSHFQYFKSTHSDGLTTFRHVTAQREAQGGYYLHAWGISRREHKFAYFFKYPSLVVAPPQPRFQGLSLPPLSLTKEYTKKRDHCKELGFPSCRQHFPSKCSHWED